MQFKRWFGNSKVNNAGGTPKVMYRGAAEAINVFDRKKSRAGNLYGRGFNFTEDKNAASRKLRDFMVDHYVKEGKYS